MNSIINLPELDLIMVVSRITDYTTKHYSGVDNIPHLCVKVKHLNGFAWFGINIVNPGNPNKWFPSVNSVVKERLVDTLKKIIDLESIDSDMDQVVTGIKNLCVKGKRPILFGGDSNIFIQINATNNIQIEVYRNEVKPQSVTFGGYFMLVELDNVSYPAFMYHRSVILPNYIDEDTAIELMQRELLTQFAEVWKMTKHGDHTLKIRKQSMQEMERNRIRWTGIK